MPFPHGLQFLPPSRYPVRSALVLPMSLGLLAAACGNPSASEAARTDTTRLVSSSRNLSVDPVIQWNRILLSIVRTPGAQPATLHPTRSFAMMHAAIYDAVNASDGTYHSYQVQIQGVPPSASQEAATAAAAHRVLAELYPSFGTILDAELQQSLGQISDGADKDAGIAAGESVADQTLALRRGDGSDVQPAQFVFGAE